MNAADLQLVATPETPGFIERFAERARLHPARTAVEVHGGTRLTYRELFELTERIAGALLSLGVAKGDRVLIAAPSGPEFIASFYAIASLSAIAVPLAEGLTAFEFGRIAQDAEPKGAVIADASTPLGAQSLPERSVRARPREERRGRSLVALASDAAARDKRGGGASKGRA